MIRSDLILNKNLNIYDDDYLKRIDDSLPNEMSKCENMKDSEKKIAINDSTLKHYKKAKKKTKNICKLNFDFRKFIYNSKYKYN
jgi:hypothetical protein